MPQKSCVVCKRPFTWRKKWEKVWEEVKYCPTNAATTTIINGQSLTLHQQRLTMLEQPLILTLKMDEASQAFFNAQRRRYFPPELNFLDAHLMLFHQLPNQPETFDFLTNYAHRPFTINVTGLINLGAGVAYRVDSPELRSLHKSLSASFRNHLIPQDLQGFRPHITIMNKQTPEAARALLAELSIGFQPFTIQATGLDLWTYLGGPWNYTQTFLFE